MTRSMWLAALLLVTGWSRAAYCQWLEISCPAVVVSTHSDPPACSGASGSWSHIWPAVGGWTITTDAGPLEFAGGLGPHIAWGWTPGGPTCDAGWWDYFALRDSWVPGQATHIIIADDGGYLGDDLRGDNHDAGRFRVDPTGMQLFGEIDGYDMAQLAGAETIDVRLLGGSVVVYIGPYFESADFDRNGAVEVPDIFAFLAAWFAGDARAGLWDGVGGCSTPDIFSFLSDWFEGAP